MSALKDYDNISINGTPYEYQVMPTSEGSVVWFYDNRVFIRMTQDQIHKALTALYSRKQMLDFLLEMGEI